MNEEGYLSGLLLVILQTILRTILLYVRVTNVSIAILISPYLLISFKTFVFICKPETIKTVPKIVMIPFTL